MGAKLTFWEWWFLVWGFGYLVNHNEKEIHDLSNKHVNCHTDLMTNKEYAGKRRVRELLSNGYNGCAFCNKEFNRE